jgi:zinc protease
VPALRDLTQTQKLSNGLTLVTRRDRTSPRIAYSLLVRAGAADETVANAGWRRILTEAMLRASLTQGFAPAATRTEGGKTEGGKEAAPPTALTGLQMQRLAEAAGGQIGASVGDDAIEFWAVGETRGANALLDVLLQVALHPRLGTADIDAARRRVAAASEASQDDIAQSATAALRAQIYRNASGAPLAYGLTPQGTETSRRALTEERLRAYFRAYFQPGNIVLAAAGSVEESGLAERLQNVTAPQFSTDNSATDEPIVQGRIPAFAPIIKTEPALLVRQLPTADAWIFVSFLSAPSNGADLPALAVMAALLGEAPGARLPHRLLGSRPPSLGGPPDETAQQAAVSFVPRRFGSEFVLYAQTESNSVENVKNALLDEARKLRETTVSEGELTRAKNYVRGSWSVDREPLRERAYNAALAAATGAEPDVAWPTSIQKVTPADIRRAAQKYLGGYAVALIMPQQ